MGGVCLSRRVSACSPLTVSCCGGSRGPSGASLGPPSGPAQARSHWIGTNSRYPCVRDVPKEKEEKEGDDVGAPRSRPSDVSGPFRGVPTARHKWWGRSRRRGSRSGGSDPSPCLVHRPRRLVGLPRTSPPTPQRPTPGSALHRIPALLRAAPRPGGVRDGNGTSGQAYEGPLTPTDGAGGLGVTGRAPPGGHGEDPGLRRCVDVVAVAGGAGDPRPARVEDGHSPPRTRPPLRPEW